MFGRWLKDHALDESDALDALLSLGILRVEQSVSIDSRETSRAIRSVATGKTSGWPASFDHTLNTSETLSLTLVGVSLVRSLFPDQEANDDRQN